MDYCCELNEAKKMNETHPHSKEMQKNLERLHRVRVNFQEPDFNDKKVSENEFDGKNNSDDKIPENFNPNAVKHYATRKALKRLEMMSYRKRNQLKPLNFSPIKLYLITPEGGRDTIFEFWSSNATHGFWTHSFDPRRPTKIICHGWLQERPKEFYQEFFDGNRVNNNMCQNLLKMFFDVTYYDIIF